MRPLQVWGKLYGTIIVVAIWCANTHSLYLFYAAHLVDYYLQRIDCSVHIVLYFIISLRLNGSSSLNLSPAVNDTEDRVGAAEVQADNIRLQN